MIEQQLFPWGDTRRYNSYSRYFRALFGGRMQKVTIDAGFSCPNRDGTLSTGGCTFCNNDAFSPSYSHRGESVTRQIDEGIKFHEFRYAGAKGYLAYFQSYSNTHAPLERLQAVYDEALAHPKISGLVIGTRPDCVDERKLDYFAQLAHDHYVILEYGVESCYDETLRRVNRGHDFAAAEWAILATHERGIHSGAHFIVGLPGESHEMLLASTERINRLPLDTIKFHQLQIFRDTVMEREYRESSEHFRFYALDEYIDLFCDLLSRLRSDLVIERFAGEAPPRYHVAGCEWGRVRNERLVQLLEQRLEQRGLWQGCSVK